MGYYLTVNNTCSPCISNCDNCNNGASCNTCSNSYYLDSNGLCVLGINCSQISNCNNCTIIAGCTQCSAGYSQINSTLCSSICGDGLLSPTEECDIGNHTDGCINCYIEAAHFCTGSVGSLSTCNDCAVNCLNCTSLTTCSLCEDYFQILPNNSC
jgi:proprotein convertase subtilisin/kexin type 5